MTDVMLWTTLSGVVVVAIAAFIGRWIIAKKPTRTALLRGTEVHYTNHAKERMAGRGITAAQVESVLADPARTVKDPENNSVRLEGDVDGSILKVWITDPRPARRQIVIKSTAWNHILEFKIPSQAISHVIGRDGKTIRSIEERTGTRVSISQRSTVRISAGDRASAERAQEEVKSIVDWLVRKSA